MTKEYIRKPITEFNPEIRELLISIFGDFLHAKDKNEEKFNLIIEKETRPKTLYHYTSVEVLYSILENIKKVETDDESEINSGYFFTMRGTDITFLNDFSEFEILPRLLADAIRILEEKIDIAEKKNLSNYLSPDYLQKIANFFGMFSIHVFSFSENSDNLPMWTTYGHDGKGVALGLDLNKLNIWCNTISIDRPMLVKCSYDQEKYNNLNQQLAKEIYNMFSENNGKVTVNGIPNFDFLAQYFSSLKNIAYEYENEWRLIKVASDYGGDNKKFHQRNGILKPYVELKIPLSSLKEIIVGPCSNNDLVKRSIDFVLDNVRTKIKKRDLGIEVKQSNIPYRII